MAGATLDRAAVDGPLTELRTVYGLEEIAVRVYLPDNVTVSTMELISFISL
jgi:hypothetical protein